MIWQKQYQLAVYDDEKQDTLTTFFSQSFAWKNPGFWRTVVIKYQQKQGRFLPGCLSPCIENHYQQESPLKMQYSTMAYSRVTTTIVNLKHLLFSRSEVLYLFFDEVHLHSKRLYSHFFFSYAQNVSHLFIRTLESNLTTNTTPLWFINSKL